MLHAVPHTLLVKIFLCLFTRNFYNKISYWYVFCLLFIYFDICYWYLGFPASVKSLELQSVLSFRFSPCFCTQINLKWKRLVVNRVSCTESMKGGSSLHDIVATRCTTCFEQRHNEVNTQFLVSPHSVHLQAGGIENISLCSSAAHVQLSGLMIIHYKWIVVVTTNNWCMC